MVRFILNILRYEKDVYDRLMEDLNFFMLRNKIKSEMIYYVHMNTYSIVICVTSDGYWTEDSLNKFFRNIFKNDGAFILNTFDGYRGLVGNLRSNRLNRAEHYFLQPIKTKRILLEEMYLENRKRKILKLINKYKNA